MTKPLASGCSTGASSCAGSGRARRCPRPRRRAPGARSPGGRTRGRLRGRWAWPDHGTRGAVFTGARERLSLQRSPREARGLSIGKCIRHEVRAFFTDRTPGAGRRASAFATELPMITAPPLRPRSGSSCRAGCSRSIAPSRCRIPRLVRLCRRDAGGLLHRSRRPSRPRLGAAGNGRRGRGRARCPPASPLAAAQLPRDRPRALPARDHPPGDPPVLHRERQRGRAVLAPAALARVPAREGRVRQAAAGHPARRPRRGLRVDQPLAAAHAGRLARLPHHHRRRLRAALQRERLQHQRDELRRRERRGDPRPQRRREERQLRPRHGRGLDQRPPSRARRRPHLGGRLGLLRLPRSRRQLRPRALRAQCAQPQIPHDRAGS